MTPHAHAGHNENIGGMRTDECRSVGLSDNRRPLATVSDDVNRVPAGLVEPWYKL